MTSPEPQPRPQLSRRGALLAGAGLCAALAGQSPAAGQPLPVTPARFLAVSARLCGVPLDDEALAAEILSALLARTDIPSFEFENLAIIVEHLSEPTLDTAIPASGLERVAERVVAAWYSGMAGPPGQERVLSFTGAAAWLAMGYGVAPTECAGFGTWSTRPL